MISQFFLYPNCSKNITCLSGKLKREFTSLITKSTCPELSDTTFFALLMVNFEPGEYMRTMIFQSVTQAAWKKNIRLLPVGGQTYNILVTSPDALPLSHRRSFGAKFMCKHRVCNTARLSRTSPSRIQSKLSMRPLSWSSYDHLCETPFGQ